MMANKILEFFNIKRIAIVFFIIIFVLIFGLLFSVIASFLGLDEDGLGFVSLKSLNTEAYVVKDGKVEKIDISLANTVEFDELYLYSKESYVTNPDGYLKSFSFEGWNGEFTSDTNLDGEYLYIDFYTCEESMYSELIKEITGDETIELPDLTSCKHFYSIRTDIFLKEKSSTDYEFWDDYYNFRYDSEGEYFLTHIYTDGNTSISNFNFYFYKE